MASIYQSIELLSKEKGIDPQIVLDAVKDAMLAAARKHFRSQEELVADLDENTGNIQIYSLKQVVDTARKVTGREIAAEVAPRRRGDPPVLVASSTKIKAKLGWEPRYPALDDIVRTA